MTQLRCVEVLALSGDKGPPNPRLGEHLASCAECRAALAVQAELLATRAEPDAPRLAGLARRMEQNLDRAERPRRPLWAPALGAGALAAAAAALLVAAPDRPSPGRGLETAAAVAAEPLDGLEHPFDWLYASTDFEEALVDDLFDLQD
jgi:hypothetical protein